MKRVMKSTISVLLVLQGASGFGSLSSGFTKTLSIRPNAVRMSGNMLMYDVRQDPSSNRRDGDSNTDMWTILANTEKWLSGIVGKADSPYARKECTYVCELGDEDALMVAGLWRRLREARELGETHGQTEEQLLVQRGASYTPRTFRQTQVVVIPNHDSINNSFQLFNKIVETVNLCRRNARDYILDKNLEKIENSKAGAPKERDWSIAVNLAHLHPSFGELSKKEQLQRLEQEEQAGEVDVNMEMYRQKRMLARQSPYPTLCIEVRSTPPPDFSEAEPSAGSARMGPKEDVSAADIQKLEALFGMSAEMNHPTKPSDEEAFFDSLSRVSGIQELSFVSPMVATQNWIAANDEHFGPDTSTFSMTDTVRFVDEAYEHVFANIAMNADRMKKESFEKGTRQYLIFSSFMSSSATSFEKFTALAQKLLSILPSVAGKVSLTTFHPEHVDSSCRSPEPVLVVQWKPNV